MALSFTLLGSQTPNECNFGCDVRSVKGDGSDARKSRGDKPAQNMTGGKLDKEAYSHFDEHGDCVMPANGVHDVLCEILSDCSRSSKDARSGITDVGNARVAERQVCDKLKEPFCNAS